MTAKESLKKADDFSIRASLSEKALKSVVKAANSFKDYPSALFIAEHDTSHHDEKRWKHMTSYLRIKKRDLQGKPIKK